MGTKEIYRSFAGKLGVENQTGYIITSIGDGQWIEYEDLSVYQDEQNCRVRFRPDDAPTDWTDLLALGEIVDAVDHGRIPGQVYWRGKWRSPRDLIAKYQDYNWRRNCK